MSTQTLTMPRSECGDPFVADFPTSPMKPWEPGPPWKGSAIASILNSVHLALDNNGQADGQLAAVTFHFHPSVTLGLEADTDASTALIQTLQERLIALKLVLSMPKSGMDEMLESLHNMQKFYQDRDSSPPPKPSVIVGPPMATTFMGHFKQPPVLPAEEE